jgi:hypothetical protein
MTAERAEQIYTPAFQNVVEYVVNSRIPGDVLEFGTFHGYTARTFAELLRAHNSDKHLHLYDSWEGFPEMKGNDAECPEVLQHKTWNQGDCNPVIPDADKIIKIFLEALRPGMVHTHKGFYTPTMVLPDKAAIVHIDCDLYESTYMVLKTLIDGRHLQQGTVILFDDWNNNFADNGYGERKAMMDVFPLFAMGNWWLKADLEFESIGYMGLEPWFSYGSSGKAFIVQIR